MATETEAPAEQMEISGDPAEAPSKEVRHRKKQFYKDLRRQMEFYFSDANLTKNRFMGKRVLEDPNVDLNLFLTFNKIRALTMNTGDIVKALRKSDILAVTEDGTKVYRTTAIRENKNEDDCTIYVEHLPPDAEHEWLRSVFLPYGSVPYISIPKYNISRMNKGFAFVEFDSSESANRALEAFNAMGCRIPTQIHPDQLCSNANNKDFDTDLLIGRDGDNGKEVQSEDIFPEVESVDKKVEDVKEGTEMEGNCVPPHKKRRRSKQKSVDIEASGSEDLVKDIVVPTDPVKPEDSGEVEETLVKKRKKGEDTDEVEVRSKKKKNKRDSECGEEESKQSEEMEREAGENGEEKENEEEERKKKKNRRHKKKVKKEEQDADPKKNLRILPKAEWKRLRNKYLSLQKSKMMNLKQHLARSRWGANYSQEPRDYYHYGSQRHEEPDKETAEEKPSVKPVKQFSFIPGVIVHVRLEEPVSDTKAFKASARTHAEVLYVDLEEGASEAHIRCASAEAAKRLATERHWRTVEVLAGTEETEYWDKITRDRDQKLGGAVVMGRRKTKRGRDKLLKKAEKALGKHIRFDEHE